MKINKIEQKLINFVDHPMTAKVLSKALDAVYFPTLAVGVGMVTVLPPVLFIDYLNSKMKETRKDEIK